jgi:hypothetical protein
MIHLLQFTSGTLLHQQRISTVSEYTRFTTGNNRSAGLENKDFKDIKINGTTA